MKPKTTIPKDFEGWNVSLTQIFGLGPKWTITCGECGLTFKKRLPMVSNPGIECQFCGVINIIPVVSGV